VTVESLTEWRNYSDCDQLGTSVSEASRCYRSQWIHTISSLSCQHALQEH